MRQRAQKSASVAGTIAAIMMTIKIITVSSVDLVRMITPMTLFWYSSDIDSRIFQGGRPLVVGFCESHHVLGA